MRHCSSLTEIVVGCSSACQTCSVGQGGEGHGIDAATALYSPPENVSRALLLYTPVSHPLFLCMSLSPCWRPMPEHQSQMPRPQSIQQKLDKPSSSSAWLPYTEATTVTNLLVLDVQACQGADLPMDLGKNTPPNPSGQHPQLTAQSLDECGDFCLR